VSYCALVQSLPADHVHRRYHDNEYGFPIRDEAELFARLTLEINQAGLSWLTILRKQEAFVRAFDQFVVDTVAAYDEGDVTRLLGDAGIVRNERKIRAVIENARRIQFLRASHGGFANWLHAHHPRSKPDWVKLFKKNFVFVGGEIVGEFLMSIGYLPGAHEPTCPIDPIVRAQQPPWLQVESEHP
jgi:DNA-3-methyladenine glycosylase I